jgi:hypothetical protein
VDTFFFDSPDVGRFQKLVIGHDNSGFGAAWKLSKVEIVNTNSGEQAVFPANRCTIYSICHHFVYILMYRWGDSKLD